MSISDESIRTLLDGRCPANFHSPIRLADKASAKWLENTILSLAMTGRSEEGPVRLLYLSDTPPELSSHFQSYKEWIKETSDATWRSEPNWRQYPMTVGSTQLIKFKKRFRVLRGNCLHNFLVEKTARLELHEDAKTLLISQYSQKHGKVKLYTTDSVCAIEGVFLVQNLHPDFDGFHVGMRSSTEKAICIVFRKRLFSKNKSPAQGVTICFAGTIKKGLGFYEIHRSSQGAGQESCDEAESPSDDSDDEHLEPQEHPNPPRSLDTQLQHFSSNPVNSRNYKGLENSINPEVWNVENLSRMVSALRKKFSPRTVETAFAEARSEILEEQEANGNEALRSYQQEAVDVVMQPGNYLLYAATGAGKTRIFIEVARRILESKVKALVVVVVPKIALTSQHAKDFEIWLNEKHKYSIHTFCSGTTGNWERKWNESNVAITTADYFANRLNRNIVKLNDIDLIILDEAHETKGNNPYFCVMSKYKSHIAETGGASPKVFGVTATPARGPSRDKIEANLNTLLEIMHVPEDHLVIINDNNKVILKKLPQATPETAYVKSRTSDVEFIKFLAEFLRGLITRTLPDHFTSNGLSLLNNQAPPSTYALLENGDSKGRFQQWKGGLLRHLSAQQDASEVIKKDIEDSLWTICTIQQTVDKCKDVGFEVALTDLNSTLLQKEREFSEAMIRVGETAESQDELLFFKLNAAFFGNHQVRMLNQSTSMAGSTSPLECGKFPKFAKLVEIIGGYKDRDDIHGIVFVRTRLGADWISNALQQSSLSPYFTFKKIVGRGKRNNSDRSAITGMNQNELKTVLEWFKQDGKKILVSTSVCEEGINVASCELIVRYNVPLTSTEYKQSLGRARKRNARFVNIIEKGSKEPTQLIKTEEEVKQSKTTIMSKPHAIHIR